ncbi:hypothetical protein [Dyadobacter sp. CY347]|nr:hypothetical protein [Dyadobacter sp. CY347]
MSKLKSKFQEDNVWLTNLQLVALLASSKANISEHIKNIFYVQ